jgi:hypothetical protein
MMPLVTIEIDFALFTRLPLYGDKADMTNARLQTNIKALLFHGTFTYT